MTSHFNAIIDRHNTGSVKWDFIDRYLQLDGSELLPMWVSDFDFPCPPEVQQALHQRLETVVQQLEQVQREVDVLKAKEAK